MDKDDRKIVSHATHTWVKKIAEEELVSWSNQKTIINKGDTYYEYTVEIKLYGTDIDYDNPVVLTEKEYFKQVLTGTPGFKYYDTK